jgi:hypothetical protein
MRKGCEFNQKRCEFKNVLNLIYILNQSFYTQGMTKEQEAMTFYNVVGPLSMLEIQAMVAKHSH